MKLILALALLGAASLPAFARSAGSGPGNGTDYVKVLFADAQFELNRALVGVENPGEFALSAPVAAWLKSRAADGEGRFAGLRRYVRTMELRFQDEPCSDGSGKPASICFFTEGGPYVMISVQENKQTTRDQAMAMLLHEAGHFTGEMDHLFLDRMGVELTGALKSPHLLFGEASDTEIVANIFSAKEECEAGTSALARRVRQEANLDLARRCEEKRSDCRSGSTEYIFHGVQEFKEGTGFTMKLTCQVKAIWRR